MDTLRNDTLLYLTGFMGSGKTTIGRILANTLGYSYLDLDLEIEASAGKTISELFLDHGEQHFRKLERELLTNTGTRSHCVISLGGGTIANDENLRIVRSAGLLIYLKAGSEQLFQRMKHKVDRPMLRGDAGESLTNSQLHARIDSLLAQREPYYTKADIIVSTDARHVGITVDDIVKELKQFTRKISNRKGRPS